MNPIQSISQTSIELLLSEPFYGHFLMTLPKSFSKRTNTLAVHLEQQSIQLFINEQYWSTLNKSHRYGLLKHEALHIIFKHFIKQKHYSNKTLFNLAADLVVNQYIQSDQLPKDEILLENFRYLETMYGIKLEAYQDVDYYYQQLKLFLKTKEQFTTSSVPDFFTSILKKQNSPSKRHLFWKHLDHAQEGERKIIDYQANRIIKENIHKVNHRYDNFGNLPQALSEKMNLILKSFQPQFDWRRLLRLFANSGNRTIIKNTIRRPSKRYATVPGIKVKKRQRLLIAIDTSGSLQDKDLNTFFSEVLFIWRQGADIQIVECDNTLKASYSYQGQSPSIIHGRGSTDFDAAIKYANEIHNPDALIYFTDGFGSAPTLPVRYPVLWLITSEGLKKGVGIWNALPGKKLKMNHV